MNKFLCLFVLLGSFCTVQAQLKVASLLTDNMVLQRNTDVKLWGKAKAGEKLSIQTEWNKQKVYTVCNEKGDWLVKIKTTDAGGPYSITIASAVEKISLKNILLGEVWLCSGQSNMEMPMSGFNSQPVNGSNDALVDSDNDQIRLLTILKAAQMSPQDTCPINGGSWKVATAETVSGFSAVAYFYARQLQAKLKVPVGVIASSWGGSRIEAWMNNESISQFPEVFRRSSDEKIKLNYRASILYNGMIAPVSNLAIKGAVWYQGESNIVDYKEYASSLAAMVSGWRNAFGVGNFPFYYVQIAPFFYDNSKSTTSALLRDEQLKAMSMIPNSGMVSTIDIGEEKIIHPAEKLTVAKRLSYWALAETYGLKGISYKSPVLKSMAVKDTVAILDFENVEQGICSFGKEVDCLEIAGADKVFYKARFWTNRQFQVFVYASEVKTPVAVRYAFCNFPETKGYFYNTAGLPVPSFRTDDWEQ